jgi:hypothetical protein
LSLRLFPASLGDEENVGLGFIKAHGWFHFDFVDVSESRASSSARRGTPRLKDWTPWMTQIFKTSKISATVAPCRSAALMNRRVLGAYRCEYEAPRAIFTNSMSFGGKALLK